LIRLEVIRLKSIFRDVIFWISIFLLLLTDVFFIGTYLRWFDFGFVVGQYRLNHWLSWLGFIFILIHVPLFFTLKRSYIEKIRLFLAIHVLGNLSAFLLISIHFAHQISRPSQFYPDLGTGVALYASIGILVITGFFQRFGLLNRYRKKWRFLHTSLVVTLFIIIIIHILQGTQIL
jgi:hypothetical protein